MMADVELFMVELSSSYDTHCNLRLNTNFVNFPPTTGSVRMAGCYGQLERGERKKVFRISKPDVLPLPSLTPLTLQFTVCPAKEQEGNYYGSTPPVCPDLLS